jgi:pimeloyl-ACP methyl ester carboxylesterase
MANESQNPTTTTSREMSVAFERHGAGVPIVLLPGLTFERRTWRPIVERLGDDVCSLAVDLPAQGHSAGLPGDLADVAGLVHQLVVRLGMDDPVVVGHSMAGRVAMIYAASYPARGAVTADFPVNLVPFVELVQRLEPALRGPGFAQAFEPFQQSMGFDRIPEPVRSEVLAAQEVRQDVVLGYWDELMRFEPERLQERVEQVAAAIDVPVLAVFGQPLSSDERDSFRRLVPGVQLEEWPGRGHLVHLADADRFAARLRAFVDFCEARRSSPAADRSGRTRLQ